MTRHMPLDNFEHADLKVAVRHAAEWGDAVNQVLVFPTEFEELQREYPILFRRSDAGEFHAVALLGLDRDENLFLGEGGWQARYVPAVRQQGPFVSGPPVPSSDGDPAVHVDLDDPRVGAVDGEPLFLRHGGSTPYLKRIAAVLDTLRRGREASGPFFTALAAAQLIRPVSLDVHLGEETSYRIDEVFTVDQERLAALAGADLEALHHSGFLRAAIMAAASLANVSRLIEFKTAREAV